MEPAIVLETTAAAAPGGGNRLFGRLANYAPEELNERAVQHGSRIVNFEQAQPLAIDVDQTTIEIENVQAVRRALDDPLVDFFCLSQRFLATFAFGDVGLGAGQRHGAAFAVSCDATAGNQPADAAITMQHPVLGLIEEGVAGNMRLGAREDRGFVVGMDQASAILEPITDLVILITEHLLKDRIDVDLKRFEITIPYADAARRSCASIALVAKHRVLGSRDLGAYGQGSHSVFSVYRRLPYWSVIQSTATPSWRSAPAG